MARISPHRTLSSLSHISQPRHLIRSSGNGAAQAFSSSCHRPDPNNKGDAGHAERDIIMGEQDVEPLTIQDIKAMRAKAGKLVAPTASYSDSDMFKSPQAFKGPKARRWDHILTEESKSREPCMLKQAAKHLKKPGLISLGGGLPSPENFPIEHLSFQVPAAAALAAGTETGHPLEYQDVEVGKHDVAQDLNGGVHDLSIAFNYGQSIGQAQLLRWVTEHTELVRAAPPYADWRCALTVGSTGALEQALRMFCDRAREGGDSLLTEEFSFATALETAAPLGIRVFGIEMDGEGLRPDRLDELLEGWDPAARGGARKPHVLYTVPSGQNPTGATQGVQRRRDIYDVCRKHDVYILEDEPYYFLQMLPYGGAPKEGEEVPSSEVARPHQTIDEFLGGLIPSLLSMDVDGRVMRMDSFSKVVVPGSRLGWITASEQIVERYIRHAEVCSQGPSGISQLVLYKLVDETWGHEGYLQWLMQLRNEYTRRRNAILDACDRFLPRHFINWVPPAAGMFLWLEVNHRIHPEADTKSIQEIEGEIFNKCIEKGVLACPGSWFKTEKDQPLTGLYFRTTFAAASEENMAKAIERFGVAIKESFKMEDERS